MITKLPADRPLPHKHEILERILADDLTAVRRRRSWLVPVSAAASIAVIAGGILVVATGHDKSQPAPATQQTSATTQATTPAKPKVSIQLHPDINIDLGPLTAADKTKAAQACLSSMGGPNRPTAVGHGIKVMTWGRQASETTIAFTSPENLRYGCFGDGKTMTAAPVGGDPAVAARYKSRIPTTDATHPAAPTEGSSAVGFIEFDQKPDLLTRDGWYAVDERVATMRQRWIVRGTPGPWYVANAADGLVFLRSWDQSTALKLGEEVKLETQVLDHDGNLLDAPATLTGHGLTPSPGSTHVDTGKIVREAATAYGILELL
ncbi:hypothetical protein AB0L70_38585 [Kribbella sp. NPDC051952]|uniref:hypothetical protein n=1 Tax=Kribbella sp. NPDC051952 TaxID=3154851 RepID=UPI00342293E7